MATKIGNCTCHHKDQDELYKGKRLFNSTGKGKISGYRCTVCGKEQKL